MVDWPLQMSSDPCRKQRVRFSLIEMIILIENQDYLYKTICLWQHLLFIRVRDSSQCEMLRVFDKWDHKYIYVNDISRPWCTYVYYCNWQYWCTVLNYIGTFTTVLPFDIFSIHFQVFVILVSNQMVNRYRSTELNVIELCAYAGFMGNYG